MIAGSFLSPQDSHSHSLETLELLMEYDDFMESIACMADMGCGSGLDLIWWATRTARDDSQTPLNIRCFGIDQAPELAAARQYRNIYYQAQDFEREPIRTHQRRFDLIWCHDSFQFVIEPLRVLNQWYQAMEPDSMLIIIVPQTTNICYNLQEFDQRDFCYHNWTMVSLIHVLAMSGFDCRGGFFLKRPEEPWLHAAVYRSEHAPQDPRVTRWYDLCELDLLPESAVDSVRRHGYVRQRDLVLPWLDHSVMSLANH